MSENFMRRDSDRDQGLQTRALEIAMEAKTIILQHQKTCDEDRLERRGQIKDLNAKLADLHISVISAKQELRSVLSRALIWLVGILVPCVGYFLVRFGLPGAH